MRGGPEGSPHSPRGASDLSALYYLRCGGVTMPHTTRRANYRAKRRAQRLAEKQRRALAWALEHQGGNYQNMFGFTDAVPTLAMRNIVREGRERT